MHVLSYICGLFLTVNNCPYDGWYQKKIIPPCTFLEFHSHLEAYLARSFQKALYKCSRASNLILFQKSHFSWMFSFVILGWFPVRTAHSWQFVYVFCFASCKLVLSGSKAYFIVTFSKLSSVYGTTFLAPVFISFDHVLGILWWVPLRMRVIVNNLPSSCTAFSKAFVVNWFRWRIQKEWPRNYTNW